MNKSRPDAREARRRFELLTPREREVLALIADGLLNKEIANRLKVRVTTVRTHRARLIEKLDIHTGPELVRFVLEHEL